MTIEWGDQSKMEDYNFSAAQQGIEIPFKVVSVASSGWCCAKAFSMMMKMFYNILSDAVATRYMWLSSTQMGLV